MAAAMFPPDSPDVPTRTRSPLHASHAAKAHPRSHPYRPPGSYADAVDEAMDESARSCDAAGCVYFSPQPVLALRDVRVRHVYACLGHAMALADDGTVYTWGDDARGQLGRGLGNAELLLGARRDAAYALAAMAGGGSAAGRVGGCSPAFRSSSRLRQQIRQLIFKHLE